MDRASNGGRSSRSTTRRARTTTLLISSRHRAFTARCYLPLADELDRPVPHRRLRLPRPRRHRAARRPVDYGIDWERYGDDAQAMATSLRDIGGAPIDGVRSFDGRRVPADGRAHRDPSMFDRWCLFEPIIFSSRRSRPRARERAGRRQRAGAGRRSTSCAEVVSELRGQASVQPVHAGFVASYVRQRLRRSGDDGQVHLKCLPRRRPRSSQRAAPVDTGTLLEQIDTPIMVIAGRHDEMQPSNHRASAHLCRAARARDADPVRPHRPLRPAARPVDRRADVAAHIDVAGPTHLGRPPATDDGDRPTVAHPFSTMRAMYPVPTSLSPSRVEAFTSCPMAFRFASIERLPESPSPHTTKGSLVHRVLELLFTHPGRPAPSRLRRAASSRPSRVRLDPEFTMLDLDDDQRAGIRRRRVVAGPGLLPHGRPHQPSARSGSRSASKHRWATSRCAASSTGSSSMPTAAWSSPTTRPVAHRASKYEQGPSWPACTSTRSCARRCSAAGRRPSG